MSKYKKSTDGYLKNVIKLYLVFSILIFIVYKTPFFVLLIAEVMIIIFFYFSKNNHFYFALLLIIQCYPGAIFSVSDPHHTIAFIQNSPLGILYFWMIFVLVAFYKAINSKVKYPFFLKNNLIIISIYFFILLLTFGIYKITAIISFTLPWIFLFLFPRLFRNEKDYAEFFNLIFSFVFFVLITQFYKIFSGQDFAFLFGGTPGFKTNISRTIEEVSFALRPTDGILIPYLSVIGSTIYAVFKKNLFSKNYLFIVLILSIFSIFITATRSWLISSLVTFGTFLVVYFKNPIKIVSRFLIPVIILILLLTYLPFLKKQSELSLIRYNSIELLAKGDLTAGGTLSRFDKRAPKVMKKFYESPIMGWGYGPEGSKYNDGHIGNQNLLMHTGVTGYSFFVFLWLNFIFKLLTREKMISKKNLYKNIPTLMISFLLGTLIINISAQWYGYLILFPAGFTLSLLFAFANFIYWESLYLEKQGDIK